MRQPARSSHMSFHTAARVALAILLAFAAAGAVGCQKRAKSNLVGTWTTTLVGYNSSASASTQYTQKVTLGEDGSILITRDLPAPLDRQVGTYELVKNDKSPAIRITWTKPAAPPSELYYKIEGFQLYTSPTPGGVLKPPDLNSTNQDPIVYDKQL